MNTWMNNNLSYFHCVHHQPPALSSTRRLLPVYPSQEIAACYLEPAVWPEARIHLQPHGPVSAFEQQLPTPHCFHPQPVPCNSPGSIWCEDERTSTPGCLPHSSSSTSSTSITPTLSLIQIKSWATQLSLQQILVHSWPQGQLCCPKKRWWGQSSGHFPLGTNSMSSWLSFSS